MGRKSIMLFGLFLLCIFTGACSKNDNDEGFIRKDNDMTTSEKDNQNGVAIVAGNEKKITDNDNKKGSSDNTEQSGGNGEAYASGNVKSKLNKEDIIKKLRDLPAGEVTDVSRLGEEKLNDLFYSQELNQDIIDRITGKSYKEDCDVPYSDLRYIRVLHIGFDGKTRIGELIVNKAIAQDVIDIFRELYSISYPIEKMILIDEYDADDIKSMADNNTSAFNFRFIEGTKKRSVHSDGLAIDINPLYNPYVRTRDGKLEILPENAGEYADRTKDNIYYIKKDDPCYRAFTDRGFTWGGEWKNSKDYQHFEKKIDNQDF